MIFTTTIALPACNKTLHAKSITNQMHENLQKFLLEGNDELIEQCFESILQTCVQRYQKDLTNIDKFVLLCKIRSISFSSTVSLVNADNAAININLESIIQQLQSIKLQTHMHHSNATTIEFYLPKQLCISNDDALLNCIHSINDLLLHTLSKHDRNKLFNVMNGKMLADAANYIAETLKKFNDVYFIPNIENMGLNSVKINPFDQSLFEILKIIFKEDLFNFYKTKYLCLSKMHMPCSDFDKLTPADARLFLSFYNEEISQQNESLKNSNKALSNIINEQ